MLSESKLLGPVLLGDFSAHLGCLGGQVGAGEPNVRGVLLQEVMDSCRFTAVSLGSLPSGAGCTYCSGKLCGRVDHVLTDVEAIPLMSSCHIHPMKDLIASDHLPLTVSIRYGVHPLDHSGVTRLIRVD